MKTDTYTPTKIETWPVQYEAVKVWRETTAKQCTGALEFDGRFCALGLLGGYELASADYGINGDGNEDRCPICGDILPVWRGLDMVAHWNDFHRLSFKEIADLAEAYPHLVFTS